MWWLTFHHSHGWLLSRQSLNISASWTVESSVYIFLQLLLQPVAPIVPFFSITILNPFKGRFYCKYFCLVFLVLVYNVVTFSCVQMLSAKLFFCQRLNIFAWLTVKSSVYLLLWLLFRPVAPIVPFSIVKVSSHLFIVSYGCCSKLLFTVLNLLQIYHMPSFSEIIFAYLEILLSVCFVLVW